MSLPDHSAPDDTAIPSIRARATQDLLAAMDGFQAGLQAKVRERVGPEVMSAVETATPTHWLPISQSRVVVEAAVHILGESEAPKLWRYFFANHYVRSPLLRFFVDSMLRVMGTSPNTLFKKSPGPWSSTYRNFATLTPELIEDEGHTVLVLTDISSELMNCPAYFVALQGAFEGVFDVTGRDGTCQRSVFPETASARFDLRW